MENQEANNEARIGGSGLNAGLGNDLRRPVSVKEKLIIGGPPLPEDFGLFGEAAHIAKQYGNALEDWVKTVNDIA